ncbi:1,6-anhydro-N-acetylmuramyl-L-alanine amidase AmpD [Psychrobacter sp. APC 3281]|uniref:1,6-anhydro-N-acetylmuramyl-L-alanine amidase AmpD n=1 Tax=Psychrobacter sp. APC 3281 TaxID=3035190 RepID=UPI0025B2F50C|nr:1,6-anhydro-N-acetylmuramyl-L-alanine amidase AmpD [Psychrobacter sp. APC 3281]MDN3448236.1 1,6-anhydro-N-acetylmuramyl-L-alanine amidase AmpD [Psychrobacter sp. APC 3281]
MPVLSPNSSSMSSMFIKDGLLSAATWLASPNYNVRPKDLSIDAIVVHNISLPPNEFGACDTNDTHYVKALFTNQLDWDAHPYFQTIKGAEVSAHLFIERDGAITQFVNFNERAWHAGRSSYLGRPECNDYSIGIELEGSDFVSFTSAQYEQLAKVIATIYKAYPKTRRHLTGHSDIAPGRKTDPGDYFEWARLRELVAEKSKDNSLL